MNPAQYNHVNLNAVLVALLRGQTSDRDSTVTVTVTVTVKVKVTVTVTDTVTVIHSQMAPVVCVKECARRNMQGPHHLSAMNICAMHAAM